MAGGHGYAIGIDLGTSNTVAVLRWPDGRTRSLLFDGQPILPSGVYLDDAGRLHVGRDAQRMALMDPARYEPNPKRRIDEQTVLLGDREGPTVGLLTAILQAVGNKAKETCGVLPPAVITHPAAWGVARRGTLTEAANHAGWPLVRLVPEPIAAARYFADTLHHPIPDGGCLAVFDFGGGTLDVAVVRNMAGRFEVIGSGGTENLGGLDIDAALVDHLGKVLEEKHPEVWRQLSSPQTPTDRRHRRLFWEDVRGAKEMLSRASVAPVPVPGVDQALHVTREELEQLARPLLARAVDLTAEVIDGCRLSVGQLVGVFLVGGTSRIPLVAQMLHTRLGVAPTALEQPELPVAEGALAELVAADSPPTFHASPPASAVPVSGQPPAGGTPPGHVPPGQVPPGQGGTPGELGQQGAPFPPPYGPPPAPRKRRWWLYAAAAVLAVLLLGTVVYYVTRVERPFSNLTQVASQPLNGDIVGTDIDGERAYAAVTDDKGRLRVTSVNLSDGKATTKSFGPSEATWREFGAHQGFLTVYSETSGQGLKHTVHVLNAETLQQVYRKKQPSSNWLRVQGDRLIRVDPDNGEYTWIDPASGRKLRKASYDTSFRVDNWADYQSAASVSGYRFQAAYPDNRLVTISDEGTLRVLQSSTGKELKTTSAEPLGSGDHGMAYQGMFLVAGPVDEGNGYQVQAYDLDKLGEPKRVFRDLSKDVTPQRIVPCGESYACLVTSAGKLVVFDFKTGEKVWDKKLAEPDQIATILPIGERIMVNYVKDDSIRNVVFDDEGTVVYQEKGWGAPVDAGSELRFDAAVASFSGGDISMSTGVMSLGLTGVGAVSGEETSIGAFDADPSTCSWNDAYIACAGSSDFLVYRFRDV